MRASFFRLIVIGVVSCTSVGCGTIYNLDAPPKATGVIIGPSSCTPFGGAERSAMLGTFGTALGLQETAISEWILLRGDVSGGCQGIGDGLWLAGMGLAALVDTPISLVGDVVTLPIVVARRQQHAWASWESGAITSWIQLPSILKSSAGERSSQSGDTTKSLASWPITHHNTNKTPKDAAAA